MAKRKKRRQPKSLKPKEAKKLDAINDLIESGELEEAEAELWPFARSRPNLVEGWDLMINLGVSLDNAFYAWYANRQLVELEPYYHGHRFNAAVSSVGLSVPFSTLHHISIYIDRWPDGPYIDEAREIYDQFAPVCDELREGEDVVREIDIATMALFEEAQILVGHGEYKEGRELSEQVAPLMPGFPSPLNNVSLSYAVEGKLEKAIRIAQQVLDEYPENIHARSNMVQYLVRLGRADEACLILDGLCNESPQNPDHCQKIIEAFAFAGDDDGVIEVYNQVNRTLGRRKWKYLGALTHHLAAVAYAHMGQIKKARKLWNKTLQEDPSLDIAHENLADSHLPVGERHGAWCFPLSNWMAKRWIKQILHIFERDLSNDDDEALQRNLDRVFENNPGLDSVLPILLERGGPMALAFVLRVASHHKVQGLREFALGKRGPDPSRMEAARYASMYGEIDATKPVELYVRGKPREVMLLDIEVHGEPKASDLSEKAQTYLEDSLAALHDDNLEEALDLVEAGLELAPDEMHLLYHKSLVLRLMGRTEEANDLLRRVAATYPDYLFARCAMAKVCVREKKLDEAQTWLEPLLQQKRLHFSEFRAVADAQITLSIQRDNFEAAQSWARMWKEIEPDSLPLLYSFLAMGDEE